jgi:hypothetical protein
LRALAGLICTSEASINAYLRFGAEEANAFIIQHRAAVLATAEALMIYRTLDAAMIDSIINSAPERARAGRLGWGFGKRGCLHRRDRNHCRVAPSNAAYSTAGSSRQRYYLCQSSNPV